MNKNNITLIAVSALVIGGLVGYGVAAYQYSSQLSRAKSVFPSQEKVTSVGGTIKNISGNVITIETPKSANPFEDTPTVREITVTSATSIVKREPKDPKEFQQEMDAFQKLLQKTVSTSATATTSTKPVVAQTPPLPFTEITLALSDLKAGDTITVESNQNIKTATSFEVVKITLTAEAVPAGTAPIVNTPPPVNPAVNAPVVNTPPPANPAGTAPIVNTPPPAGPGAVASPTNIAPAPTIKK